MRLYVTGLCMFRRFAFQVFIDLFSQYVRAACLMSIPHRSVHGDTVRIQPSGLFYTHLNSRRIIEIRMSSMGSGTQRCVRERRSVDR